MTYATYFRSFRDMARSFLDRWATTEDPGIASGTEVTIKQGPNDNFLLKSSFVTDDFFIFDAIKSIDKGQGYGLEDTVLFSVMYEPRSGFLSLIYRPSHYLGLNGLPTVIHQSVRCLFLVTLC